MKLKVVAPILGIFGTVSSMSMMGNGEEQVSTKLGSATNGDSKKDLLEKNLPKITTTKKDEKDVQNTIQKPSSVEEEIKDRIDVKIPSAKAEAIKTAPITTRESEIPKVSDPALNTKPLVASVTVVNTPAKPSSSKPEGLGNTEEGDWDFSKTPAPSVTSTLVDCKAYYFVEGATGSSSKDGLQTFKKKTQFKNIKDLTKWKKLNWKQEQQFDRNRCDSQKQYLYVWIDGYGYLNQEARTES